MQLTAKMIAHQQMLKGFILFASYACTKDANIPPCTSVRSLKHIFPESEAFYEIRTKEDWVKNDEEYSNFHYRIGVNIDTITGNQIRNFLKDS